MRWTTWFWSRFLLTVDRLLGSQFLEWELARRQRKIARLLGEIGVVNRELDELAGELAFCRMVLCLVELKARSECGDVEDWLLFSPHCDGEEALLDNAIECLVKTQLAKIHVWSTESGHYSYQLEPDWAAIVAQLRGRSVALELMSWLEWQLEIVERGLPAGHHVS